MSLFAWTLLPLLILHLWLLRRQRATLRFQLLLDVILVVIAGISVAIGSILLLRIPPIDALLVRIPLLDEMTVPRLGVLISWGLIVLASLAFDGAARGRRRAATRWRSTAAPGRGWMEYPDEHDGFD